MNFFKNYYSNVLLIGLSTKNNRCQDVTVSKSFAVLLEKSEKVESVLKKFCGPSGKSKNVLKKCCGCIESKKKGSM